MPATEDKHERFTRLATKRMNNALRAIELLGNLSNPASYEYSEPEIRKMFETLDREIATAQGKFANGAGRSAFTF